MFAKALRIAEEDGDPETACWVKSNHAFLVALRGDIEEGLELSRRSLELTERLGDVFSRTVATSNLAAVQLTGEDSEAALESIESAERIYLEAMPEGGEMRVAGGRPLRSADRGGQAGGGHRGRREPRSKKGGSTASAGRCPLPCGRW